MDKLKLTATITAILTFLVVIAQNCFGIIIFADTDPGTLAGMIVTIIMAFYAAWKTVAEYIANARAKAAESRVDELEAEIVAVKATAELAQSRYEKAIAGLNK